MLKSLKSHSRHGSRKDLTPKEISNSLSQIAISGTRKEEETVPEEMANAGAEAEAGETAEAVAGNAGSAVNEGRAEREEREILGEQGEESVIPMSLRRFMWTSKLVHFPVTR